MLRSAPTAETICCRTQASSASRSTSKRCKRSPTARRVPVETCGTARNASCARMVSRPTGKCGAHICVSKARRMSPFGPMNRGGPYMARRVVDTNASAKHRDSSIRAQCRWLTSRCASASSLLATSAAPGARSRCVRPKARAPRSDLAPPNRRCCLPRSSSRRPLAAMPSRTPPEPDLERHVVLLPPVRSKPRIAVTTWRFAGKVREVFRDDCVGNDRRAGTDQRLASLLPEMGLKKRSFSQMRMGAATKMDE